MKRKRNRQEAGHTVYEVRDATGAVWKRLLFKAMAEAAANEFDPPLAVVKVNGFVDHDYNAKDCQCALCSRERDAKGASQ